ncbi:uncharacterized protein PgNI_04102 [Pyricularia grisea]|uniref:Uncharacterized protein n=1 Tax=Pyricularia grisea TaxID=148305 RepID=A0A6P8BA17_PYRGI|nr:uncharacterized protein PgNI_04102 [Pyricularia grisea]TLD12668.1 hypothetical protein PgNI_04102 [Pyricularia grisea]
MTAMEYFLRPRVGGNGFRNLVARVVRRKFKLNATRRRGFLEILIILQQLNLL